MVGSPPPENYQVNLGNWRKYPYTSWSFVNVRSLIPTAKIDTNKTSELMFKKKLIDFNDMKIIHNDTSYKFKDILKYCDTDAFLVLHKGILIFEYFANFTLKYTPHIIFSISKSLTSLLTGILFRQKLFSLDQTVSTIIPETKGTAYEEATIRNVLDMNVSSNFVEDYTGKAEIFKKYRFSTGWDLPENDFKDNFNGLYDFLTNMPVSKLAHGTKYHYCSPNTDLLGWIIEKVSKKKFYNLMSNFLFQPSGTIHDANVTLDKWGASRSAGGVSVSPYDLLLIAELVRCEGSNDKGQIIPASWINDFINFSDNSCYLNQDDLKRFPNGNYRSKWYQTGFEDNEYCALEFMVKIYG